MLYIPGMSNTTEVKEIKKLKAMLDTLNDAELDRPEDIDGLAKQRISLQSNQSLDDVNKMIFFFNQSKIMHEWLSLKKSLKERLPTSEAEMQLMQENDMRIRSIANKIGKGKGKKSGRGRGLPF